METKDFLANSGALTYILGAQMLILPVHIVMCLLLSVRSDCWRVQRWNIVKWLKQSLIWEKTWQILVTAQIKLLLSAFITVLSVASDSTNDMQPYNLSLTVLGIYSVLFLITCFTICKYLKWDDIKESQVS